MLANMKPKAELLQRDRFVYDDGAVVEMVIWRVPTPVAGVADFLADVKRQRAQS